MCEVNPEFKDDMTKERRKDVVYNKLKNALYGCKALEIDSQIYLQENYPYYQ